MPIDVVGGGSPEHQEHMRQLESRTRGQSWHDTDFTARCLLVGLEAAAAVASAQQDQIPQTQPQVEQE
jgi:hypothetical protein